MKRIERLGLAIAGGNEPPDRPIRVLGIDLGTTNSTVSELRYDPISREIAFAEPISVEQHAFGETIRGALVPSVVAFVNGNPVVGHAAARFRATPDAYHLRESESLFAETKNDIGIGKIYYQAPEGFRTPGEIAGHVLRALYAEATDREPADRVVVTVPASFETRQREETVHGASLAGLDIAPGELLDEPVAIFVESMMNESSCLAESDGRKNVLVFDFGGGTCDVAVFAVTFARNRRPQISPLAVSRYHRLGGGDIDRAIVYEELIPQLVAENGLSKHDLGYDAKRDVLEPLLISVAESLKIELSRSPDLECATQKRTIKVEHDGRSLRLTNPKLTRARFDEIVEPFVDLDLTWDSGNEYRTERSIFAPIEDALDRAGLDRDDVDVVLLAGGAGLVPNIDKAIGEAFTEATIEAFSSSEDAQTAVSRGAAYHAMALELFGRPMVRPTVHEAISIQTTSGRVEIVPKGTELPFPKVGTWHEAAQLRVPRSCDTGTLDLRVEIEAGTDGNLLESRIWEIPAPVERGESLSVLAAMDENKLLQVMLVPASSEANPLSLRIENPVTRVINPGAVRLRIEETERALAAGKVEPDRIWIKLERLADDYADIGFREKALDRYRRALKKRGQPVVGILLQMGLICGHLGDDAGQEKYYLEAAATDPTHYASLFNLALAKWKRDELDDARRYIDMAIDRGGGAAYYVLKARIASEAGDLAAKNRAIEKAEAEFAPVQTLSDFELGWFESLGSLKADPDLVNRASAERKRRLKSTNVAKEHRGELPVYGDGPDAYAAKGAVN